MLQQLGRGDGRGRQAALPVPTTPWSRSVYSGSKRHVVLGSLLRISYLLDELVEMLRRVNEIDPVRIHHQQRRLFVPVKVMRVRLAELLQIRRRDRLFVGAPALLDALQECIKIRLEIDHEVRPRHLIEEEVVQPVVDHQLGVIERQMREDLRLRERIVGEDQLGEEIALRDVALLIEPREQEKQLRPERGAAFVFVEVVEERIARVFEDFRAAETLGEQVRERGFAYADRTFDRNMTPRKIAIEGPNGVGKT